ncbi:hypothetical protein TNCV_4160701 [Trichonephila clavipes]|nr:hypothetical protein TNCV_4160701 [Trichonephila clavipes]
MSSFPVLCEGDTRNRWRDGQVCPDVGQGRERKKSGENERKKKTGNREERERKKKSRARERGAGLGERKRLSPGLEWKDDERRWLALSQRSSSPRLIEDETLNESGIITKLIDNEDGLVEPDSLIADQNMPGSSFPTTRKAFS